MAFFSQRNIPLFSGWQIYGCWPVLMVLLLTACGDSEQIPVVLSEKPPALAASDVAAQSPVLQPRVSDLGLRLRLSYADLKMLIERQMPQQQQDEGAKRICKRVLGIKVCASARWAYELHRTGDIEIGMFDTQAPEMIIPDQTSEHPGHNRVGISMPLEFNGTVGVSGDLARTLGLQSIAFDGAVNVLLKLSFDVDAHWCPVIQTEVTYDWQRAPRVEWVGGLDFNVRKLVDETLQKELQSLDQKIAQSIDCQEFRRSLAEQWRSYSIPIDVPMDVPIAVPAEVAAPLESDSQEATEQLYINLVPNDFAFSGVVAEAERLGVTFVLNTSASVEQTPLQTKTLQLPPLKRINYQAGSTDFDLLLRLGYPALQALAADALLDQTFSTDPGMLDASIRVRDVQLFPSAIDQLTLALSFEAELPGQSGFTNGTIYLTSTPRVDSAARQITLENIQVSKILDSKLWSLLTTVFNGKIVAELEKRAVVNLHEAIVRLEVSLLAQLSDPEKTQGAVISARQLSIDLVDLSIEADALAALLRVSSLIDIDLPASILNND